MTRRGPRVVSARARATTVAMIPRRRNDTIDDMVDRKLLAEMRGCVPARAPKSRRPVARPSARSTARNAHPCFLPPHDAGADPALSPSGTPRGARTALTVAVAISSPPWRVDWCVPSAETAPETRPLSPSPDPRPIQPPRVCPEIRRASVRAPDVFPKPSQRAGRPGARSDQPPNLHPAQGPGPGRRGEESRAPREAQAARQRGDRRDASPNRSDDDDFRLDDALALLRESEVRLASSREECAALKRFLADYGMKWVGDAEAPPNRSGSGSGSGHGSSEDGPPRAARKVRSNRLEARAAAARAPSLPLPTTPRAVSRWTRRDFDDRSENSTPSPARGRAR